MAYSKIGEVKKTVDVDKKSSSPIEDYFFNVNDVEILIQHVKEKDDLLGVKIEHIDIEGKNCPIMVLVKKIDSDGGTELVSDYNLIAFGCPPILDTNGGKKFGEAKLRKALGLSPLVVS